MNNYHTPVLLKEVIELVKVQLGKKYIDATIGGGGHTKALLEKGARVLGIDVDQDALEYVRSNQESRITNHELVLTKGNFKDLGEIAHLNNFNRVSAVLFDLGVSSHQVDSAERGFSFLREGPLDMRMDKEEAVTAETLVNLLGKGELYDLFNKLGQEHRARTVSSSIVGARKIKAIQTTQELADVVAKAYGITGEVSDFTKNKINQKVFQALRMAVNNELENIENTLPQALELLEEKGRIAVISFHSLEDGIVKKIFKGFAEKGLGQIITEKPIEAGEKEKEQNSRSRSAKLRVFERN
ncbi:MAG TPA: 16S rRNA (cytosine(1402)-N(4))-methyltransferase RsmH [Patescibacteria group bacterium]|jgi:16S rRNA (cytosine1402-N4)-methyltransferase|nr:16S rRNA (cytosine(1402)-N(4))-methyltransferase RsmH [Patescibacteria group bacterium]